MKSEENIYLKQLFRSVTKNNGSENFQKILKKKNIPGGVLFSFFCALYKNLALRKKDLARYFPN